METLSYKIRSYLFLVLIVVAPLHAFLITWLESVTNLSNTTQMIVSGWREIIVAVLACLVFIEIFKKRDKPKLETLDYLIVAYTLLALIWGMKQNKEIFQWLLGFRLDVFPILFYLVIKNSSWNRNILIKGLFISAIVVIVFGLLHSLILPRDFLIQFGYGQYQAEMGPDSPLPSCHFLEHTQQVCRNVSTFGGPTRYGTYLLAILGLSLGLVLKYKEKTKAKIFGITLAILSLISIALTYSRSVWVAAAAIIFIFIIWLLYSKQIINWNKKTAVASIILAALIIISGIFGYNYLQKNKNGPDTPQFFKSIFVRTNSTDAHSRFLMEGLEKIKENPLGIGLGKVGSASQRLENPLLTENWFLQIALEMGIVGAILFVLIIFLMMKKLAENNSWLSIGLFFALLGIAITGIFTHSFEETTTTLLMFGLMGIVNDHIK